MPLFNVIPVAIDQPVLAQVDTTNATLTTLYSFTIPSGSILSFTISVNARRTGGIAGTTGDGADFQFRVASKNPSGTAAVIGSITNLSSAQDQGTWDCTFDTSGSSVRVRVKGAVNNNITWNMKARVMQN